MLKTVVQLSRQQDTLRAVAHIESQGSPVQVADAYSNLIRSLYYQEKDVPLMMIIGRAGIAYCLRQAEQLNNEEETAIQLKGMAKTMSYNASVNAWPAWQDEGITITSSDQHSGHDLARLNLRLAVELKRDADKLGHAYWLLGAHQLAAAEKDAAIASFRTAAEKHKQAGNDAGHFTDLGYVGIVKLTDKSTAAAGRKEVEAAIASLGRIDSDDARFLADQLKSVSAYFAE